MEEKSTDEIIKDHYASLPEPVKKAIGSFDWAREIFDIGRSHSLHVDQIGDLQTEVMLVVLGLATPQDFYNQMVGAIAVPNDIAQKIIEEANEKVFNRIRDFMKNYYDEDGNEKIHASEEKVLKSAGISLGEEESVEPKSADDIGFALMPGIEEQKTESAPVAEAPKVSMPKAQVFKTPIPAMAGDKPKNFFDPYREPLE
jgi:hypothetical protein